MSLIFNHKLKRTRVSVIEEVKHADTKIESGSLVEWVVCICHNEHFRPQK